MEITSKRFIWAAGNLADLETFFFGKLRVGNRLLEILASTGVDWKAVGLAVSIEQAPAGMQNKEIDQSYRVMSTPDGGIDTSYVLGVLAYLQGEKLLEVFEIGEKQDSVIMVIYYFGREVVCLEYTTNGAWYLFLRYRDERWETAPKVACLSTYTS